MIDFTAVYKEKDLIEEVMGCDKKKIEDKVVSLSGDSDAVTDCGKIIWDYMNERERAVIFLLGIKQVHGSAVMQRMIKKLEEALEEMEE